MAYLCSYTGYNYACKSFYIVKNTEERKMYNIKIDNTKDAIAYAIYMIVGSYFKKTVCLSVIKERQLKVIYGETKKDTQLKMEERCIKYVDSRIVGVVPDEIFDDMVEVRFFSNKKDNRTEVIFEGFDWKLKVWGESTSTGIMYDYKFVSREEEN